MMEQEHTFAKTVFDTADTKYSDNDKSLTKKLVEGTDYEIKYVDNIYGKDNEGAVLVVAKVSTAVHTMIRI